MVAALKVPVLCWDAERVAQPPTDTDPSPPRLQSPGTPHCPPDPAWWSDSTRQPGILRPECKVCVPTPSLCHPGQLIASPWMLQLLHLKTGMPIVSAERFKQNGVWKGFRTCPGRGKCPRSINGSRCNYNLSPQPPAPAPAEGASWLVFFCHTGPHVFLKLTHSLSSTALGASPDTPRLSFQDTHDPDPCP